MNEQLRVYELAKELKKTSQDLIDLLAELGTPVKGYLSSLDSETCITLRSLILGDKKPKPAKAIPVSQKSETAVSEKAEIPKSDTPSQVSHKTKTEESLPINKLIEKKSDKHHLEPKIDVIQKPKQDIAVQKKVEPKKQEPLVSDMHKKEQVKKETVKLEVPVPKNTPITLLRLSKQLGISMRETEIKLIKLGIVPFSPKHVIPNFAVKSLTELFGIKVELPEEEHHDLKSYIPRAPVITIMGHVDHGKTTLLDTMRKTRLAEKELGGITQAIGAYSVEYKGKKIVFIDTPGHEAFTAMRAKGSEVTDIVVLVVASDEGVKEQTIEAINHAKAAKVPIIVALNKIDKPGTNIDLIKSLLSERGLAPEEWGGDTIYVPISAKNNIGIDDLLEMILLKADMMELKTNAKAGFAGTVIESNITKTFGAQATVVVQTGTLKIGDLITDGTDEFKIRVLYDDHFKPIKSQIALAPVNIQGLPVILKPGSILKSTTGYIKSDAELIDVVKKADEMDWGTQFLGEIDQNESFSLIVKADGEGTLDAVTVALSKITIPGVVLKIVHMGVGIITENDILLASVSHARIVGFNVTQNPGSRKESQARAVLVKSYRIIFELIDDITAAMKGILEPEQVEQVIGTVEVKAIFKIPKVGTIAGCIVRSGLVNRNSRVRIIRNRSILLETTIDSLKRFKDDVKEVREGFECGIGLENFNDIKVGDTLEVYKLVDTK